MESEIFSALLVLLGDEGVDWYHLPLDIPEWTLPNYYHQN